MTIVMMSNWKYILILVSIHKSCIVYFEKICCADRSWKFIFFLVMEKSWKIIVEKESSPWYEVCSMRDVQIQVVFFHLFQKRTFEINDTSLLQGDAIPDTQLTLSNH